ncbi:hypothetical protein H6G93_09315 [Nostoc sp. FACHB-973]|nr:hypothetical protein [Nostoc sp. FACHB-973]
MTETTKLDTSKPVNKRSIRTACSDDIDNVLTYDGEDYFLPEDEEEWDGLDWEVHLMNLE